jgi:peroxiredoxin
MNLQTLLDSFCSAWESRVGKDTAKRVSQHCDSLCCDTILGKVVKAGTPLPLAKNLLDEHGKPFDLAARAAEKPLIILFYRGGWCPYCNHTLRAYQAELGSFRDAGAELIAISPELPKHVAATIEKNDLTFPVLSDINSGFAEALGLRFSLSDVVKPLYEQAGTELPSRHGDGKWALPITATLIVGQGGIIKFISANPDYRKRLNPEKAVDELNAVLI